MKQLFNTEPFTKTNKRDYLLIIPLAEEIVMKFIYFKLKAWELIGNYPSLHSTAHITINHDYNVQSFVFEEKLAYYQRKIPFINAFEVKIDGFGYFKHTKNSYSIFANVELDPVMKQTISNFNRTFAKRSINTPHIIIAKAISEEKFKVLWDYFKNVTYKSSSYADRITVLETPTRKFHNLPMRLKTEIGLNKSAGF